MIYTPVVMITDKRMLMQVVPGYDMAGVVVEEGSSIPKFEIGDEVFGNIQDLNPESGRLRQQGTLAEFIAVEKNLVAKKPGNISFEAAASFPLAVQRGFNTCGFKEG